MCAARLPLHQRSANSTNPLQPRAVTPLPHDFSRSFSTELLKSSPQVTTMRSLFWVRELFAGILTPSHERPSRQINSPRTISLSAPAVEQSGSASAAFRAQRSGHRLASISDPADCRVDLRSAERLARPLRR